MNTTDSDLPPNSWTIYLLWTGATVVSISSGVFIGTALNKFLWTTLALTSTKSSFIYFISRAMVDGLIIGIIIGFFQWLVLKSLKLNWRGWILVSVIGWCIGIMVTQNLNAVGWWWVMLRFLAGAIIGFSQWIVLRNHLPSAYWWIINNSLGCYIIVTDLPLIDITAMHLVSFKDFIFPGLILGLITSATLSYLLTSSFINRSAST